MVPHARTRLCGNLINRPLRPVSYRPLPLNCLPTEILTLHPHINDELSLDFRSILKSNMYSSPRQLAYAPTPYSYTPSTTASATINLDEEVKLSTSSSERDLLDSLAEIYSIIITLDGLEKAFNKDSVTNAEYVELCTRLLKQYQSNLSDDRVAREFGDLEGFKAKWDVSVKPQTPISWPRMALCDVSLLAMRH